MNSLSSISSVLTGAQMHADAKFISISTDSRTAKAGQLFVALRGEKFDAHSFLHEIVEKKVAAVLVEKLPAELNVPAIVVPDTLVALNEIAAWHRSNFSIPIIGVAGSNGKTTVKEMISCILAAAYGNENRLSTQGNLNNEIGVPLTLMNLNGHHRAAVVEMGMNHPGEISRLAATVKPTVALVNNAQREHQEFMHTVEAVARENGSILSSLSSIDTAIFPGDDLYTGLWRELSGAANVLTFGLSDSCDVRGVYRKNEFGSVIEMSLGGHEYCIRLNAAGEHNVLNALAAAACASAAGISHEAIVAGLESFEPVKGRLQKMISSKGVVVIDDTYNANPDSVRSAIDVLAQAGGDRLLVLGDMGEVGAQGAEFHEEIGLYACSKGIASVLVTGELTRHMIAFGARHFEDLVDLHAYLDACLAKCENPTVLVKGSRFMKMESVVKHLLSQ